MRQVQVHHKGDVILDLSVILFSFIRENVSIYFFFIIIIIIFIYCTYLCTGKQTEHGASSGEIWTFSPEELTVGAADDQQTPTQSPPVFRLYEEGKSLRSKDMMLIFS